MAQKPVKDPTHIQIRLNERRDVQLIEDWTRWTNTRKNVEVFREMGALYALQERSGILLEDIVRFQETIGMSFQEVVKGLFELHETLQQIEKKELGVCLDGSIAQKTGIVIDSGMLSRWD